MSVYRDPPGQEQVGASASAPTAQDTNGPSPCIEESGEDAWERLMARWRSVLAGFPTVRRRPEGGFDYWAVADTCELRRDEARGQALAARTRAHLQEHPLAWYVLWDIVAAIPPASPTGRAFVRALHDVLVCPSEIPAE